MNPEITQLIERYLSNELSESDRVVFEQKLAESPKLQQELILQQQVREGAKRAALRTRIKQIGKKYHFRKKLIKAAIITVIAGTIAVAGWLAWENRSVLEDELSESEMAALVERLDKLAPMEFVPTDYFDLSEKDTVVLSENGVLLSVPEGAFLLNGKVYDGRKIVQWQEAMDASTIVKGGLSTLSGDRLLETQGMFGVQAFTPDGKKLDINPKVGLYVQVPVDEIKPEMQLFEGKPTKNGAIDWQNPKPLEKLPIYADMSELNFYPPDYEPKLNELKWNTGKKDRDSLYLSFEEETAKGDYYAVSGFSSAIHSENHVVHFNWLNEKEGYIEFQTYLPAGNYIAVDESVTKINPEITVQPSTDFSVKEGIAFGNTEVITLVDGGTAYGASSLHKRVRVKTTQPFTINGKISYQVFDKGRALPPQEESFSVYVQPKQLTGKQLFEINCATCHRPHTDGTGPKLFQARQRWAEGGAKPGSIYQWVQNWKVAASSDPYARMVSRKKPTDMMSFPELTAREIDAIFDYIDGKSGHIPPSKVLAFWNPKFNNTILATRDFEKRMRAVHRTCSKDVLAKYTNNLNKPLYEIDEMVAAMGYPEFTAFAGERVGGIHLDNPHMNNLDKFYANAIHQLREEVKKDKAFLKKMEMNWDRKVRKERKKETIRTSKRENIALQEEYNLNLRNVARQLGLTVGFGIHGGGTVYNIDKYVMDATVARQTTVITDPNSGKTATITYNDFTVSVDKPEQYNRLFLYLFPKELNSFQRIDPKSKGFFDYRLNNDIQYDLAVIGINESGYYIHRRTGLNSGALGTVSLEEVSETTFNSIIEDLNTARNDKPMKISQELSWLAVEKENYKVQRQRRESEAFRREIRWSVFPCETGQGWESQPAEADSTVAIN